MVPAVEQAILRNTVLSESSTSDFCLQNLHFGFEAESSIFLVFISILFSIQTSLGFVLQTFCGNADFMKVDFFFLHVHEFG